MIVHQVLSGAGPHDAVTRIALACRARFRAWGWGGSDLAARLSPGLNGAVAPLAALRAEPEDVLLLHHSAYAPRLSELLALPNPKLLLYHNITPADLLWDHAPVIATYCAVGRAQLSELVPAVDVAAGDSAFNARELAEAGAVAPRVIAPLLEAGRGGPAEDAGPSVGAPATVMFVGRLSPHKRQDAVIRAFALYRRVHAPDARLVLVGAPVTLAYARLLRQLAETEAPGAVSIEAGLTDRDLDERYRSAHAFLCLSAHEGFCLPLLEAFRWRIPVVARLAGAIPEVAGDAALLLDDPDPAVVAELLALAIDDGALRAELIRRGQARAAAYAPSQVAPVLRAAVEEAAGSVRR
ncbi:MAG: glycosyltransferase [Actinomycetota bacterium]|nr:glycosyltransferase [Actinomycetota bacterium]